MKKSVRFSAAVIVVAFIALLVIKPERYLQSSFSGIKLWAVIVLPSLLPYFFLTSLATRLNLCDSAAKKAEKLMKFLFRSPGISAYVFFMSILSGYPVGAKIISDLYENNIISEDEATRMSTFCSTSGPLFIVGSVGTGMFGDKIIGYKLIIAHILSAIICGIIFRNYGGTNFKKALINEKKSYDNILYDCIYSSVISVLCVGGFITIFYVAADAVSDFKILYPITKLTELITKNKAAAEAFSSGLIECTRGCMNLSLAGKTKLTVSLSAGLISFGGVSVIMQSLMYLNKAKVKTRIFLLSKTIQTFFAIGLCFLLCLF